MPLSTLFIPDISGFTKFVKSTEISHSRHIIEELINIIIKEGSEVFELAEIEGDAVFFYKQEACDPEVVERVSKQIFQAFHSHISNYETNRICQCGACLEAVDLKLKFVAHEGETELANFTNQKAKPYGDPVIAIHRLLKNDVDSDEYVLYSKDFLKESTLDISGQGIKQDGDLGEIPYSFLKIDAWKQGLPASKAEKQSVDFEVKISGDFNISQDQLFNYISDFRYRSIWNTGADEIRFDEDDINQAGSNHYCVIDGKNLDFTTIKPDADAEILAYGEVLKDPGPVKYLESNFFVAKDGNDKSVLQVVIRVTVKWRLQLILLSLLKKKVKQQADIVIAGLQEGLEKYQQIINEEEEVVVETN